MNQHSRIKNNPLLKTNDQKNTDPLYPYINEDQKAFNGNWKAFIPMVAIGGPVALALVMTAAGNLLKFVFGTFG